MYLIQNISSRNIFVNLLQIVEGHPVLVGGVVQYRRGHHGASLEVR